MDIRHFQECRTADGWQPVEIPSASEEDKRYLVMVNPWGLVDENICGCNGYFYRGTCRHQKEASDRICAWRENGVDCAPQTAEQRDEMICPSCGGMTRWSFEVIP